MPYLIQSLDIDPNLLGSNPQETADLVTFTEEILNGKLHFFFAVILSLADLESNFKPFHLVFPIHEKPK